MSLKQVLRELLARGVCVAEHQVRHAIKTGKVRRPEMDPQSLTFRFKPENVTEIAEYFASRRAVKREAASV